MTDLPPPGAIHQNPDGSRFRWDGQQWTPLPPATGGWQQPGGVAWKPVAPQQSKSGGARWGAIIVSVLVVGAVIGAFSKGSSKSTPSGGGTHSVTYEVTGSARSIDVTFSDENGNTSQQAGRAVPWRHTIVARSGAFLYISAQNQGESGDETCRVYVDGVAMQTNTSTGAFTICTVGGTL